MSLVREALDHLARYRRLRSFGALGARRGAAASSYRAHAFDALRGKHAGRAPGWATVAGFRVHHLGEEWMRYLYREVFAQREYWFATDNATPYILDCGGNIGTQSCAWNSGRAGTHVYHVERRLHAA